MTAHPVGLQEQLVNFYGAGGKNGIMGRGGMVQMLLNAPPELFLSRPNLHFWYNNFVFSPLAVAFFVEVRRARDVYLAQALPQLDEELQVTASRKLEPIRYSPGSVIVSQGDIADKFYIITQDEVEVLRQEADKPDKLITKLGTGQYFGELGLIRGGKRIATVRAATDVEVMALDRDTFGTLMDSSEASWQEMDKIASQRALETEAMVEVA